MSYNSKYKGAEVEELLDSIGNKVDKVDGKQLSTEDFTTLLKQKLEGLSNYDDIEIQSAVSKLRTDLDTLVSGDTTTAIKTFNEVIAFLDGLEDTEDLASIIASIERQIAAKQDTLFSGTNIKTINGTTILGSGNIVIEGGAKVYTLNWDGESEYVTLSQEEYDNIVEADIVVLSIGEMYHVPVVILGEKFSEELGALGLVGRLNLQGIEAIVSVLIDISTKLATFTMEEQSIPTKNSQLENDSNFVSSDGLKTINGESIVGSGDIVISSGAYAEVNHETSDTTFTLTPNTFHVWDEVATLDLSFGAETDGVANEYLFQFTSGATATTLTLPDTVEWVNGALTIEADKTYQISIVNNIGLIIGV